MITSKEKILSRIADLLSINQNVIKSQGEAWNIGDMEKATLGTLTLFKIAYGDNSKQEQFLINLRQAYYVNVSGASLWNIMIYVNSSLETLREEIELGFIDSIEKKAFGEVYGDLLTLSKELIDKNYKEAAVVLACGALEDSFKKYSQYQGLDTYDAELSKVINSLKAKSLLKGAQAGIAQSYVQLRNKAFHAQFDKIDTPEIKSLIAFVEAFILENFN